MKKLLLFLLVFVLLSFVNASSPMFYKVNEAYANCNYKYYVTGDLPMYVSAMGIVENKGLGHIVTVKGDLVNFAKQKLTNIVGESISLNGTLKDVNNILNLYNAKIINTEYIGNTLVLYAASNYFKNSVIINDQKVNIQVAFNNGSIIMGSPLILGSF